MSLRTIHVIFITCSIILFLGFSYWTFNFAYKHSYHSYYIASVVSCISAIALLGYGYWFIKKTKKLVATE